MQMLPSGTLCEYAGMMMPLSDLISALGGPLAVGAECGVGASAVSNWVARGSVAAEHRVTVWRMATKAGLNWAPPGCEGLRLLLPAAAPTASEAAA